MGIALGVFLVGIPVVVVALAARTPSAGSLRRLFATIAVDGASPAAAAAIGARVRRRRTFGAIGGVLGMWATASWESVTFTWAGLLPKLTGHTWAPGFASGWLSLNGPSFFLALNLFGILVGFAAGVVVAEWAGRGAATPGRRAALLAPRDARRYVARWADVVLTVVFAVSGGSLVAAALVPESLKTYTGRVTDPPWWAIVLLAVGVVALLTRALVVTSPLQAVDADELVVREITRALTAATMTLFALATFMASTAATLDRISAWFGWGWGDGLATAALASSLVATALAVAGFVTPYWLIATEVEFHPHVAVT